MYLFSLELTESCKFALIWDVLIRLFGDISSDLMILSRVSEVAVAVIASIHFALSFFLSSDALSRRYDGLKLWDLIIKKDK
jgi:hypothetical protein